MRYHYAFSRQGHLRSLGLPISSYCISQAIYKPTDPTLRQLPTEAQWGISPVCLICMQKLALSQAVRRMEQFAY